MNKMYLYRIISQFIYFVLTHKRLISLLTGLIFISTNLISQPNAVIKKLPSPIGFIKNCGQVHDQYGTAIPAVLFLYPAQGFNLQLRKNGFSYDLYTIEGTVANVKPSEFSDLPEHFSIRFNRIDVSFVNPNPNVKITGIDESAGWRNYYNIEGNPSGIIGVPVYNQVIYHDLYPGIDLIFFTDRNQLKYNFILKSGANLEQIRLKYDGLPANGFQKQEKQIKSIQIKLENGFFSETIPSSWVSGMDGKKQPINVFYSIHENGLVGFNSQQIIQVDNTLTIDPVPIYSSGTYYGGSNADYSRHITTDSTGNVYLSGYTYSLDHIATTGAYMSIFGGGSFDAFLAKLSPVGSRIWATYFGGSGNDDAFSAAVDDSNNVYMAGYTRSTSSITTPGSHQSSFGGGYIDGFLVKFDSNGLRKWSTYYGGDGYDRCYSVISLQNNVIIAGQTQSSNNIATSGSHQPLSGGNDDAFIAAFNSSGQILWGSYYGGSGTDYGLSLAKDNTHKIYLAGHTNSVTDIASLNGFQTIYGGGNIDGFLAKFNISGNLIWGTYIGGDQDDEAWSVTSSPDNNVYITGVTNSANGVASPNAFKDSLSGTNTDAFLIRFTPSGQRSWATYYGGDSSDAASSLTFSNNKIYLTGYTYSTNNISTAGSYSDTFNGYADAYIAGFDTSGYRYWGTYFGGIGYDEAFSITSDLFNNIYIAGYTESKTKIADSNAFQDTFYGGSFDAFVAKFRDPCFGYTAQLLSYTDAGCAGKNDGSAVISVIKGTAPYSYLWNSGDTGSINLKLKAGTWFCTVGDYYGCLDTVFVRISEPSVLTAVTTITDVSCAGDSNGFVGLSLSGGTNPYSYLWNTGDSLNNLSSLPAGMYSCIISDSNNCKDTIDIEIGEPAKIIITPLIHNPACFNGQDGNIKLSVTGGIMPYSYLWDSGDTTSDITSLTAGKYNCVITDSNHCTERISISLNQPDSIQISFLKADDTGPCNGYALAFVIGGVRPYDYYWSRGLFSDSAVFNLCAGKYQLEVEDSNHCKAKDTVIIDLKIGIMNQSNEKGIILYPNPIENYIQLHYHWASQKSYDLMIYSTDGKEILNKKGVEWDTKFDVSILDKGIYLVKIITGERAFVVKVVK